MPYATDVKALLYHREDCFAPLKNATGADSITDVKKALQKFDQKTFRNLTGTLVEEETVFELDPQFYYPTSHLLRNWKGKAVPNNSYLQP